jgi:hypothetical protein
MKKRLKSGDSGRYFGANTNPASEREESTIRTKAVKLAGSRNDSMAHGVTMYGESGVDESFNNT